jgi:hypothetical protein
MKVVLVYAERLLQDYLEQLIRPEIRGLPEINPQNDEQPCIKRSLNAYKRILEEKQRQQAFNERKVRFLNPQDPLPIETNSNLYTTRSATDSLLFRLIVALQLCLLRIDDAHSVITGRRMSAEEQRRQQERQRIALAVGGSCFCLVGAGVAVVSRTDRGRA